MSSESRIKLEQCGRLGIWIYFDGELIDLIHLSDLQKGFGVNQKTKDAIDQIYNDIILEDD